MPKKDNISITDDNTIPEGQKEAARNARRAFRKNLIKKDMSQMTLEQRVERLESFILGE